MQDIIHIKAMAAVEPDVCFSPRRVLTPLDGSSDPGPGSLFWASYSCMCMPIEAKGLREFQVCFHGLFGIPAADHLQFGALGLLQLDG